MTQLRAIPVGLMIIRGNIMLDEVVDIISMFSMVNPELGRIHHNHCVYGKGTLRRQKIT